MERKRDYISRVFYLPEYAKELRLSKVKPKLYEEFQEASAQILDISKKRTRRLQVLKMCIQYGCSSLIFDGIYLTYLMFQTLVKEAFGYGTAVTLYNSCGNLRSCSQSLAQVLTEFPEHGRYIEKIRHFLNCPVEIRQKEEAKALREEFAELNLDHVSFSYPGGASVLKDISLTIRRGERIALVGVNGAGKTTFVKLLCGIYEPDAGQILINGIDRNEFPRTEVYQLFSAIFQEQMILPFTVGENLALKRADEVDEKRAWAALERAGLKETFQDRKIGIKTYMTKTMMEDGVELSGGQQQRFLLARALYKDAPVLVLDEPTAALDPIAESEVYEQYDRYSSGKTAVFISHRLASTRFSDRIVLIENGRILETGTHEELMRAGGVYAEMFEIQSSYYREGADEDEH